MSSPRETVKTGDVPTSPIDRHVDQTPVDTGHCAVVGLQFGDEGKGQIVDMLASHFDLVARYNGGANAGHTVTLDNQKFALHLIPSGILYPQVTNVVGNGVVIDLGQMLSEINDLRQHGVKIESNLRVSERAHVVLPYHKAQDALYDQALTQIWKGTTAIGTTGRGIGPCYADKALRSTAVRICDLFEADELKHRIARIVQIKNVILAAQAQTCGQPFEQFDDQTITNNLLDQTDQLRPHICDTTQLLHGALADGKRILYEGANAVLLDIDHGTYPFATSSHCSSLGIHVGTGLPATAVKQVLGVLKLYTSRVGGGPFPTELDNDVAEHLRQVGNEYGTTTGRPRRCGWLDLMAAKYAAQISGATALVCTGLSVLAGLDQIKVCVGYRYRGRTLPAFPASAVVLAGVEPIWETFDGFSGPIQTARSFAELPKAAHAYIEGIEDYVGVKITMVCIGRKRNQILVR